MKALPCPICGKSVPSVGHTTMICPNRGPIQDHPPDSPPRGPMRAKGTRATIDRGPIMTKVSLPTMDRGPIGVGRGPMRQVKWSDLRELNIKKLQALLPCEVLADGEVIARLEKP